MRRRLLDAHAPLVACATAAILLGAPPTAMPKTLASGAIRGSVIDRETNRPLDYCNVLLLGTTMGAMASPGGEFHIPHVPVGSYRVKASYIGYAPQTIAGVRVEPGQETQIEFALRREVVETLPPIVVTADPLKIDVKGSHVEHVTTDRKILELPVTEVLEVVALNPGVVVHGGEIIVRTGRPGEVSRRVDGVPVDDPLSGGSVDLGILSVAQSELITGGMDAEFGNANSAILNFTTKSGGSRFQGNFRYMTDDYGRADKTYTNFDRYSLGFGGPTPFDGLTYYVSGEATFMDGEYLSTKRYEEREFLGIKWKDRASNVVRAQGRFDWRVGRAVKIGGEMMLSKSTNDPYVHNWTTEGYTSKVVILPQLQPNRFRPGLFVVQGSVTMFDGPWREVAERATYASLEDDPACTHCLLPLSGNRTLRAVRVVDFQGRGSDPDSPLFAFIDLVLFEGFQNPTSTWVPELEGDPGDSNKVYYNSAEHVATNESLSRQLKLTLVHTVSDKTFYEVKLSRLAFDVATTVNEQAPGEFGTARKLVWLPGRGPVRVGNVGFYTDPSVPFFATAYDSPRYARRNTITYLLRADVTTQRWQGHRVKGGLLFQYNDLDAAALTSPGLQRDFGSAFGLGRNVFHNFHPEGSFYLQDRWEHEGMVVNGGVRFDFFSPGSGVGIDIENSEIRSDVRRWQTQWSPRLGLAFPITDRDVFHFHYGRFIQFPRKDYIFASQDVDQAIGTLGNPNLEPETSISYQAGIKHQFTNNLSGQFAVFQRDYFGLLSSIEITDDSTGTRNFRYVNKAFASGRGIELNLSKAFANNFAFDVAYTFSYADGVSSNPDFGRQATGFAFVPTGELPLDWDQRHTLNTTLSVARAGDWRATFVHQFGSGMPWTPLFRFEKKQDPLLENSRRLPATHILNFRGEKFFKLGGRDLRLFFDGRNLLNDRVVVGVAPGVFPGLQNATAGYREYATETGQFGGAYLQDTDGDGRDEFFPVNDPRVFGQRRLFRIGMGFEF
ncbi:MAG: TonB-dependent receptor [Candidatus Latescibacterota bacterium]|nr:MAG: TonB-dependent receptor [Candidatus Latescibacterota bacterium]